MPNVLLDSFPTSISKTGGSDLNDHGKVSDTDLVLVTFSLNLTGLC